MQRGDAVHRRFHVAHARKVHGCEIGHAIGSSLCQDFVQLSNLRRRSGDDQLAAALVADAMIGAIGVELLPARHAQPRLERALGIVDAGVNDFRIARTGVRAYGAFGLKHNDFAPGHGKGTGHGKTHHPGANDNGVNLLHRWVLAGVRR